jgi:TonB family protein
MMAVLLVTFLMGCASSGNNRTANDIDPLSPEDWKSANLENPPQPVGGLQAIFAAIRYPEDALKKRWEGVAMVQVLVDAAGRVNETRIAKSSGYAELDDEALIAVARVRWHAAQKKGKPISAWTTVPVEFRVE